MANWNIVKMDEGFIRPQVMVGPVIINGGVNNTLCLRARGKAAPYYPNATGIYGNNHGSVVHGDLVFTLMRPTVSMSTSSSANAIRVLGVSVLNGHGDDIEDGGNEILMQEINVWGIAEVPKTPNQQGFFNIIRGGIMTVRNNSKWTIQVGDYVQAYAPTRAELPDGGSGNECDAYGQANLWLAPYYPEKHSLKVKPIYRALKAKREGKTTGYLRPYLATCDSLIQSICDMSVVVMGTCFKKIKLLASKSADTEAGALSFMEGMIKELAQPKVRDNVIDRLCVPYSGSNMMFEPTKTARDSIVNKAQRECLDRFTLQTALLHHYVHKNVIGQAVSTGEPGRNFSMQFTRYAK